MFLGHCKLCNGQQIIKVWNTNLVKQTQELTIICVSILSHCLHKCKCKYNWLWEKLQEHFLLGAEFPWLCFRDRDRLTHTTTSLIHLTLCLRSACHFCHHQSDHSSSKTERQWCSRWAIHCGSTDKFHQQLARNQDCCEGCTVLWTYRHTTIERIHMLWCPSVWWGGQKNRWSQAAKVPSLLQALASHLISTTIPMALNWLATIRMHQWCVPYGVWTHDPWLIRPML